MKLFKVNVEDSYKSKNSQTSSENAMANNMYTGKQQQRYRTTIDSDQISIASLSESPPSEFKFSDEEDDEEILNESSLNNSSTLTNINKAVATHTPQSSTQLAANRNANESTQRQLQQKASIRMAELKKLKKDFHKVLLKDMRLNHLKEILLEIKQIQQKMSVVENINTPPGSALNSTSASNNSSLTVSATLNNTSMPAEMREGIERLAQCLFEFLKTSLKSMESSSSPNMAMLKSIANESPLLRTKAQHHLATNAPTTDSTSLTHTFSQYLQLWNLVEFTINLNIVQNEKNSPVSDSSSSTAFNLSKDVYLSLFQEINKYEHAINQTYLIDTSSINTSQLRRKHYFMVVLISLKVKFQLFVVNLLK
jgi:hypothetical protein